MHLCVPWWEIAILSHFVKSHFEYYPILHFFYISTLGIFIVHNKEPMFHILSHFEFIWLGFEFFKVGLLLMSCWCELFRILGGPIWLVIILTQLTKMTKFLLYSILCFNFELMMNQFDQFLNVIPNATRNFLLVSIKVDWSVHQFMML